MGIRSIAGGALVVGSLLSVHPAHATTTTTCNFAAKGSTQACTIAYTDGSGAQTRTLRLRIPTSVGAKPPVVFFLHGAPGGEYECDNTGWPEKCDASGCILVCPRGGKSVGAAWSWNSLYPTTTPDDVTYVREVIATLIANAAADDKRIYVTGFSAGGWMTHRLGYELTDKIAAIGTIASSLYIRDIGKPTALPDALGPMPVIHLQGTSDASIFYCGETSAAVNVASQDDTFAYWSGAQGNKCTGASAGALCTTTHGTSTPGGTISAVTEKHATGCAAGADVQFYQLKGGTHTYYGKASFTVAPGSAAAPYNPDVDAATGTIGVDILWKFFSAHPRTPFVVPDAGPPDAGPDTDASTPGPDGGSSGGDAGGPGGGGSSGTGAADSAPDSSSASGCAVARSNASDALPLGLLVVAAALVRRRIGVEPRAGAQWRESARASRLE